MAEMEALEIELDIRSGFNDDPMSLLPQVVPFEDWRDVQRELRAQYAEDAGSSVQEPEHTDGSANDA